MLWRNDRACPRVAGAVKRLLLDERAAATIEFVLWVPVSLTVLLAGVDATVLYLHHTEMWNVARDVGRTIAVGQLTEDEAADAIEERLWLRSRAYWVETSHPRSLEAQIYIRTKVADASVFGLFGPILDEFLEVSLVMQKEPI